MDIDALDPQALDRLRQVGGEDLLARMIDSFLDHGPARVEEAVMGMSRFDEAAVHTALHSLTSSAAYLGAHRLEKLSLRGLKLSLRGNEDEMLEITEEIAREFARVEDGLRAVRAGIA